VHPRLAELTAYLEQSRTDFLSVLRTPETPSASTAPVGWTAAQVIQHVALAESGTARLLRRRLERAIEAGLAHETETSSVLHSFDPRLVDQPLETPEMLRPQADVQLGDALTALAAARAELLAVVDAADGWACSQVTARHTYFGTLDFYQWLVFTGVHERRHRDQIARLRGA
jgi:hypothetical protein